MRYIFLISGACHCHARRTELRSRDSYFLHEELWRNSDFCQGGFIFVANVSEGLCLRQLSSLGIALYERLRLRFGFGAEREGDHFF